MAEDKVRYMREQLSIADSVLTTNTGSWGPLTKACLLAELDALCADAYGRRYLPGAFFDKTLEEVDALREEDAKLLGCSPHEVAMCESTTAGMNICLWGLGLGQGDEVITGNLENTAGFAPLNTVSARLGVSLKYADLGAYGEKDAVDAVAKLMSDRTKMVLLSHASYVSGALIDAKGVSDLCRDKGVFFCMDGVQAAGTVKVNVKEIGCDAYSMAHHKFLCGPDGAGAVYIAEGSLHRVAPTFTGVFSDEHHGAKGYHPKANAKRFDVSTRPYYAQVGAAASLKWLRTEVGYDFMIETTQKKRERLCTHLSQIPGITLYRNSPGHQNYHGHSALVLFALDGWTTDQLSEYLNERHVYNRALSHLYPPDYIRQMTGVRFSVNFWNTDEDMDKIASIVEDAAREGKR